MRWCSSALLVTAFFLPVAAQNPAPAEPEVISHDAPVTFSSRVDLVSVPVVIRDKEGHAVGGLKQKDFQLFDKGRLQIITKFTVQTSTTAPVEAPSPTTHAQTSAAPAPTAPGSTKPELPDRYVAYLFDDIHMQPGDLLNARKAANRHLATALDAGIRAGIFTTSGRTTQWFTDDVAKLNEAISRIQPWTPLDDKTACPQISYYIADTLINREHSLRIGGFDPESPLALDMAYEAAGCLHERVENVVRNLWSAANMALDYGMEETQSGLKVLTDLIAKMSTVPGARTVVLVSPGFILTNEQRFNESQILESAIRDNVVVNSLDIRGVYSPQRTRTLDTEYGGNFGGPQNGAAALLFQEREKADREEIAEEGNVLSELADGTGGSVRNDNDFEGGLEELAARPEYVYVLGFSPDNLKYDGSYHGLKVKLKEAGGYAIEARRGYWAPNRAVSPSEAAREQLEQAFFSRDEISDIPLDVHADFFKAPGAKAEISVVARLDAKGLKFRKTGDRNDERNNDTLTVVTGIFDQNGNYISGIERVIEMRLRDQSLQALDSSGISVEQGFTVPPGRYIVRVVVKDSEGRSTAARNTGIEVP